MIEKWIAVRGMNLQEYLDMLSTGASVDGLELWAASMAMNILISVIMEDSIWSTDRAGVDLEGRCFILASYTDFVPCALDRDAENVVEELAAAAPPMTEPFVRCVGHPLMSIPEYPDLPDSEKDDTDPDTLLVEEVTPTVLMVSTG